MRQTKIEHLNWSLMAKFGIDTTKLLYQEVEPIQISHEFEMATPLAMVMMTAAIYLLNGAAFEPSSSALIYDYLIDHEHQLVGTHLLNFVTTLEV